MILTAHQPAYFPWLGYFHKMAISDLFVLLDDVQFEKNSFTNRNYVNSSQGALMLTVPVKMKGHIGKSIREIEISNIENWRAKHWKSLYILYKKAPFFDCYAPWLESIYAKEWHFLIDLTTEMLHYFIKELNIKTRIILQSELEISSHKQDLVLDLCKVLNADTYVSGKLGKDYLEVNQFIQSATNVYFQDYCHPTYQQFNRSDFVPRLGIIDLLMNEGSEKAFDIILSGNVIKINNL